MVPEIGAAIEAWNRQLGVGPFVVAREVQPLQGARYCGQPGAAVTVNLGFAYIEDVQLELIEWNDFTRPYFDGIQELVESAAPDALVREFELSELASRGAK